MSDAQQVRSERRERLFAQLVQEYKERFPASHKLHEQAAGKLIDGGSHTARLFAPHPNWIRTARGAYIDDVDDHHILDFWQGHFANLLGHNPPVVTEVLAGALQGKHGLQTGMQDVLEWELANLICDCVEAEKIRFTTSGSLATMYAILLSRVHTGRDLVLKAGGGWHGAQPWGLKGVSYGEQAYHGVETEGLPDSMLREVLVTSFNDAVALAEVFREFGDRIACFLVEPFIGGGGLIAGRPDFLQRALELTEKYGALLIFDEIISGFRFRAGPLASLYGIQPDLMTLGKIMGGGMPVAAVAGRADVMQLCGRIGERRARFEGGTYSAHPLSMIAALTIVRHLIAHENEIYPRLGAMGAWLREKAQRAFGDEGILVRCTGEPGPAIPGSSLVSLHFPLQPDVPMDRPDAVNNPALCDVDLKERVVKLAFLLEGAYVIHAGGAISTAHTEEDLEQMEEACRAVARRLRDADLSTSL